MAIALGFVARFYQVRNVFEIKARYGRQSAPESMTRICRRGISVQDGGILPVVLV